MKWFSLYKLSSRSLLFFCANLPFLHKHFGRTAAASLGIKAGPNIFSKVCVLLSIECDLPRHCTLCTLARCLGIWTHLQRWTRSDRPQNFLRLSVISPSLQLAFASWKYPRWISRFFHHSTTCRVAYADLWRNQISRTILKIFLFVQTLKKGRKTTDPLGRNSKDFVR